MANTNVQQNKLPNEPSLRDLLNLHKKEIKLEFNCHAIGIVRGFDPAKQTISAQIAYKKTSFKRDKATGVYNPVLIDYPPMTDIPVVVLGGGTACLTMPIAAGDECLLLFNDRDLDNWFQSGQVGPNATARLHSFSDAVALVGLHSLAKSITTYDPVRAVLRNGQAGVGVGPTLVKIFNQTTTLNTLLALLITTIESITTTPTVPGSPAAISPTSIAALELVKAQIAGLLE